MRYAQVDVEALEKVAIAIVDEYTHNSDPEVRPSNCTPKFQKKWGLMEFFVVISLKTQLLYVWYCDSLQEYWDTWKLNFYLPGSEVVCEREVCTQHYQVLCAVFFGMGSWPWFQEKKNGWAVVSWPYYRETTCSRAAAGGVCSRIILQIVISQNIIWFLLMFSFVFMIC